MRILIIDDEEILSRNLKIALESEGYMANFVLSGKEGQVYTELNHENIDLIILDVMLQNGDDGIRICKNLRDKSINIPIIILTARYQILDKVNGLNAGADDYLTKPFSIEELLARVRALTRRPKAVLQNEIKFHGFILSVLSRRLNFDGNYIELTLKEFNLLEYLVRHHDQVVNRETLLDSLWDFSFDSFSNVVDVHVKNLRKKLEKYNNIRIIETIRGVGYRLKS